MEDQRSGWLRKRIGAQGPPLLLAGAPNALTARVLEDAGFEAIYVSGAGVTNTYLGAPDLGLLTLTEMAEHVRAIRGAVDVPLIVDADEGFGNAVNVYRTVQTLERAGANAIQIEDQITPKRCGHFDGKEVVSAEDMVGKVHAAVDARLDDDLIIIARTDARETLGLTEACDRASRYLAAGADVAFVEAPMDPNELSLIPKTVPGDHVVNMVEGGRTPILPLADLGALGFSIVLYANTTMRVAMAAMRMAATELLRDGDSLSMSVDFASWEERQQLVRKDVFDQMSERYGSAQ